MKQSEFRFPSFDKKNKLEFRYEESVVCIYGTPEGLRNFAQKIIALADNPKEGHIHLEYPAEPFITKESENAAVAVFTLSE